MSEKLVVLAADSLAEAAVLFCVFYEIPPIEHVAIHHILKIFGAKLYRVKCQLYLFVGQ